jgi:predicted cobalt transporter CbtA
MEKRIIARGLLAGAVAGVLAFIFSWVFIEPVIDRAIAYEDAVSAVHEAEHGGHDHGGGGGFEITRTVQSTIGLGFGLVLFSVAMGALFAVAFAVLYGRLGALSARALAVSLAGGAFVSAYLVPFLKYPANPPAVSLDETIQQRTLLYLLITVLSVALACGALWLGKQLAPRLGAWNATLAGMGAYLVAVAVLMLVMPTIDETPGPIRDDAGAMVLDAFAADDLYEFRLYAVGTQLIVWATIGLVFAALAARLLGERAARREPVDV